MIESFPIDPYALGVVKARDRLWISHGGDNKITSVDPMTGETLQTVSLPFFTTGLAWDGLYLWVGSLETKTLYKIWPSDGTIVSSIRFPVTPFVGLLKGITFNDRIDQLWVAFDNTLFLITVDNEPGIRSDINLDGEVDVLDLEILLEDWHKVSQP